MTIRRAVPDLHATSPESMAEHRSFYEQLGFQVSMDLGWVTNLTSPANPTAQIILITEDPTAPAVPDMSIEVADVDTVHETMRTAGWEILREVRDEEWGVRRFFVRDPGGRVVNVVGHQGG